MRLPAIFYKYTTSSTARLILEHSQLRWSCPEKFNDIHEFKRIPRFEPSISESYGLLAIAIVDAAFGRNKLNISHLSPPACALLNAAKALIAKGWSQEKIERLLKHSNPDADTNVTMELRTFFENLDLRKVRVLCMTTAHDNESMWGNYADSHKGCVLGFKHIELESTSLLCAKQVTYSEFEPVVGSGLDFLLYGVTKELIENTLHAVCCTKKIGWENENEWRVMTVRNNEDNDYGDYPFLPAELESVTLGARMPLDAEQEIINLAMEKYPECKVFRMTAKNGLLERRLVR